MQDHTTALVDRLVQFVVGHIVPGGVVLFACATGSSTVLAWFAGAQSGPTFVGFAFVLLGALALGLVISAIRYCVFERVGIRGRCLVAQPGPIDEVKRTQHAQAYDDLRRAYYDQYLAAGNLAVAIPCGVVLWKVLSPVAISWSLMISVSVCAAVATVALSFGACSAITRYEKRRMNLVGATTAA